MDQSESRVSDTGISIFSSPCLLLVQIIVGTKKLWIKKKCGVKKIVLVNATFDRVQYALLGVEGVVVEFGMGGISLSPRYQE